MELQAMQLTNDDVIMPYTFDMEGLIKYRAHCTRALSTINSEIEKCSPASTVWAIHDSAIRTHLSCAMLKFMLHADSGTANHAVRVFRQTADMAIEMIVSKYGSRASIPSGFFD